MISKLISIGLVVLIVVLLAATLSHVASPSHLPITPLRRVQMEVASTPAQWERGLIGHPPLDDEHGMLFDFGIPSKKCMWNRDVSFPVDIGFYDASWKLLGWATMPAGETKALCPKTPAKYVVEMRSGWFKDHMKKG